MICLLLNNLLCFNSESDILKNEDIKNYNEEITKLQFQQEKKQSDNSLTPQNPMQVMESLKELIINQAFEQPENNLHSFYRDEHLNALKTNNQSSNNCYVLSVSSNLVSFDENIINDIKQVLNIKHYYNKSINGFSFCTENSLFIEKLRERLFFFNIENDQQISLESLKIDKNYIDKYFYRNKFIGRLFFNNILMDNFIIRNIYLYFNKRAKYDLQRSVKIATITDQESKYEQFFKNVFTNHENINVLNLWGTQNGKLTVSELLKILDEADFSNIDLLILPIEIKMKSRALYKILENVGMKIPVITNMEGDFINTLSIGKICEYGNIKTKNHHLNALKDYNYELLSIATDIIKYFQESNIEKPNIYLIQKYLKSKTFRNTDILQSQGNQIFFYSPFISILFYLLIFVVIYLIFRIIKKMKKNYEEHEADQSIFTGII
ncbi:hypothetical protein NUSPORA_00917 [Nucleospora cyclopteri]